MTAVFSTSTKYLTGQEVEYGGMVYQASRATLGNIPPASPWLRVGPVGSEVDPATQAELDAVAGGATVTAAVLKGWVTGEAYELLAITRDSDDVVTTATVKWPDGSGGTFTRVTKNATYLTIDAFTVSHTLSGKTVTQAAVTRNANGAVTTKPALTVA